MLDYTVGEDGSGTCGCCPGTCSGAWATPRGCARRAPHARQRTPGCAPRSARALRAVEAGSLVVDLDHEDVHSAVEDWLTRRHGVAGEQLHTGRSRNDQVACDLRLYLKQHLLDLHESACDLAEALLGFAARHRGRSGRATPIPAGRCRRRSGSGPRPTPKGCSTRIESLPALWARVDRSPLGSAAGYGVPLPLDREATARALGFAARRPQRGRGAARPRESWRRRCSPGAASWATTSRGSAPT